MQYSQSRPFELNMWLSFARADLRSTSGLEIFFLLFFKFGTFFVIFCAQSDRYRNHTARIFGIQTFCWPHRVSINIGKSCDVNVGRMCSRMLFPCAKCAMLQFGAGQSCHGRGVACDLTPSLTG